LEGVGKIGSQRQGERGESAHNSKKLFAGTVLRNLLAYTLRKEKGKPPTGALRTKEDPFLVKGEGGNSCIWASPSG